MDFINTVSWRENAVKRRDWFASYAKLIDWCIHAEVLTEQQSKTLLLKAEEKPSEACDVLKQAIEMWEVRYLILKSILKETSPHSQVLERFNESVSHFYQTLLFTFDIRTSASKVNTCDSIHMYKPWSSMETKPKE